ncbi:MAG: hypothetical protein DRP58_07755 [Spirochaetes bacterium]|nr:MAG: hypothetical protein DRP58_07755 [Spirochaetota bacterium]
MKQFFLLILLIMLISFAHTQDRPLSANLFNQKRPEGAETYQCIQIRRGDIITLTGSIEFIAGENGEDKENLFFTSLGGRTFLLEGKILLEMTSYYNKKLENKNITITGEVLFEGWEDLPAKIEVTSYKPSEKD